MDKQRWTKNRRWEQIGYKWPTRKDEIGMGQQSKEWEVLTIKEVLKAVQSSLKLAKWVENHGQKA